MSEQFYLLVGSVGSFISIAGNLPMVWHLYQAKDSTGQSLAAWWTWNVANFLMLVYAIHIQDIVFICLQIAWVIFCTLTIAMVIAYKRKPVVAK